MLEHPPGPVPPSLLFDYIHARPHPRDSTSVYTESLASLDEKEINGSPNEGTSNFKQSREDGEHHLKSSERYFDEFSRL